MGRTTHGPTGALGAPTGTATGRGGGGGGALAHAPSDTVAATSAAYDAAKAAWEQARSVLEDKQALYRQKMGVMMNLGDEYFQSSIRAKYDEILVDSRHRG